ncbi:MAG: DUF4411 family protein [Rhodospirillales bacterium]|nr:DUF4411 family protein [Rhodospirillales bacterium]
MAYLLDADVLIGAKNLHYGFDFCPAFWEWIVRKHAAGRVLSVTRVGDEIRDRQDELSQWARQNVKTFFVPPSATDSASLGSVSAWVTQQNYDPARISAFFQKADYFLVGQALGGGHTVVTHEVAAPKARKIKIPDVCKALGVPCVTPFSMLRREKALFVLEPSTAPPSTTASATNQKRSLFGPGGASRRGRRPPVLLSQSRPQSAQTSAGIPGPRPRSGSGRTGNGRLARNPHHRRHSPLSAPADAEVAPGNGMSVGRPTRSTTKSSPLFHLNTRGAGEDQLAHRQRTNASPDFSYCGGLVGGRVGGRQVDGLERV